MKIGLKVLFFGLFAIVLFSSAFLSAGSTHKPEKIYKNQFKKKFGIPYCEKLVLAAKEPLYIDITQEERYQDNKNDWRTYFRKYGKNIDHCKIAPLYIAFVSDQVGYGCFADKLIKKGEIIGVSTGHLMKRDNVKKYTDYMVLYPSIVTTEDGIVEFVINSNFGGNYTRFINSSSKHPNVECRFIPRNGFWQAVYVAIQDIPKDTQLLMNYGSEFWTTRNMTEIEL